MTNSFGMPNPSSVSYTSTAPAHTYSFTGPSYGTVNVQSGEFSVVLLQAPTSSVVVQVTITGGGLGLTKNLHSPPATGEQPRHSLSLRHQQARSPLFLSTTLA